ncbi:hypothetical protein [Aminiphilus circumscriptus]|nr:hypothetical protein [Aminiphilus circumscriptus]
MSREEVDQYVSLLDNRPRKCLGWPIPVEVCRELAPPPLRLT